MRTLWLGLIVEKLDIRKLHFLVPQILELPERRVLVAEGHAVGALRGLSGGATQEPGQYSNVLPQRQDTQRTILRVAHCVESRGFS